MEDQEVERALAWLKVLSTVGHPEAKMVLRIWSGLLHTDDAWKKRFPGYNFDPESESIIEI